MHTKIPTGDPNCPPHVRNAKRIYYKIVLVTDGSMGGSEDGSDLNINNERDGEIKGDNNERDGDYEEDEEEEDGMAESNDNFFFFSVDKQEQMTVADDVRGQLDVAAAAASGRRASDGDQSSVLASLAGKRRVGEATSSKKVKEGGQKKAMSLLCCLKPQGRSLPVIWTTAMKTDFPLET